MYCVILANAPPVPDPVIKMASLIINGSDAVTGLSKETHDALNDHPDGFDELVDSCRQHRFIATEHNNAAATQQLTQILRDKLRNLKKNLKRPHPSEGAEAFERGFSGAPWSSSPM